MNLVDRLTQRVFQSALLWGGLLSVGFYLLLDVSQKWVDPWLLRCLTERWEAYLCVSMFLVGVASLSLIAVDTILQALTLLRLSSGGDASEENSEETVEISLAALKENPSTKSMYFYRRMKNAIQFAETNGPGNTLLGHLKDLADADRTQMEQRYELTRFLTWSLPAIGSLATVLGIAAAISQLAATNSAELIAGVTAGLAEAFDTFALALGLSILLVLFRFVSLQSEQRLLATVDETVKNRMRTKLGTGPDTTSSQFEQLRALTNSMIKATEKLSQLHNSAKPSSGSAAQGVDEQKMEGMVARAMSNALERQSANFTTPTTGVPDLTGWKPLQQALQQVANYLARQQAKQEDEGEVVQQLINIIDDELRIDQGGRQPTLRMHASEDVAVGLWK